MYIYKDEYCTISYFSQEKLIYLKWLRKPEEAEMLTAYNKGIEAAIKFNAIGWVADNSIGFHLDLSMQRALTELSLRRLPETNLTRFARVIPWDVFQELVTQKIGDTINDNCCTKIEIEVFSNSQNAKNWAAQKLGALASAC